MVFCDGLSWASQKQGIEVALCVMERLDCTKTLTLDMGGAEFRLLKELFSEVFW